MTSADFAARTAACAAERIADVTLLVPARIPAARPAMAFTPIERSVDVVRLVDIALCTELATVLPVPVKLYPDMASDRPDIAVVPTLLNVPSPIAANNAPSSAEAIVPASPEKSY